MKAIWGNKLAPTIADRVLADTGYSSQQTSEPEDPNRPNNLWDPVPGDHGAHGAFDDRAQDTSWQLWANTHRGLLTAAAIGGASMAALATALWRRD